jgi:WD40 repeat protein
MVFCKGLPGRMSPYRPTSGFVVTAFAVSVFVCVCPNANGSGDRILDGLPIGAVARFRFVRTGHGPQMLTPDAPAGDAQPLGIRTLLLLPDHRTIIVEFGGTPIVAWDLGTGKQIYRFSGIDVPNAIALSFDGSILAVGQVVGAIYTLDPKTIEETRILRHPVYGEDAIKHLSFSSDSRRLIAVFGRETDLWDLGERRLKGPVIANPITAIACSSVNCDWLALCNVSGDLTLYRTKGDLAKENAFGRPRPPAPTGQTGQEVPTGLGKLRVPGALAISGDGKRLAYGFQDPDATVCVIDIPGRRDVYRKGLGGDRRPIGKDNWQGVARMAMSPDDKYLVAAGYDGRLNVWRLETGESVGIFDGLAPSVVNPFVSYTRDGRYLLSGDGEGNVIIWDAAQRVVDGRLKPRGLSDVEMAKSWEDLLVKQPSLETYSAVWSLVSEAARTVAYLRERLSPLADDDAKVIASLTAELSDGRPAVREKASAELRKRGQLAEGELRRLLEGKPNAEAKRRAEQILNDRLIRPDVVRQQLAIEILLRIGTPDANRLLDDLEKKNRSTWLSDAIGTASKERRK